jgi:gliding motility-associated-like protein
VQLFATKSVFEASYIAMRKLLTILTLAIVALGGQSQYLISQGGTLNACSGTINDDGGNTGNYTDNSYTLTICPDTPGDVIRLDFTQFSLQTSGNANNSDRLFIYDGPNTSSASLGDYTGGDLLDLSVTATVQNPSGCLTIRFVSAGSPNTTFPGFSANLSCTTPCDNPVSSSQIVSPNEVGPNLVTICPGESVTVNAQGSIAQPGFNLAQYIWTWGDGTTDVVTTAGNISHTYTEPGGYAIKLVVEDNNGCQSANLNPLQVFNSTIPVFEGVTDITTLTCFGETVTMSAGNIESPTWTSLPPQVFSQVSYLSDDAGFTFTNDITYDFFAPGATLDNCADLLQINMNIEHSYMGDLHIAITCPDGTQVQLMDGEGAGTFFGQATDGDEFNPDPTLENIPGVGYNYSWSQTATNGTMGDNSTGNTMTYVGNDGVTYTDVTYLPAGTYQPNGNLCDLVGCPLNGAWTISLLDDAGADNGNLYSWSIDFNPALFPDVLQFTPSIGEGADSSYWTGSLVTNLSSDGDSFDLTPTTPGSYDFTYHVINSFGCAFDTTITVTFVDPLPFTAGPDLTYTCGLLPLQASFVGMSPATCSQASGTFDFCYDNNQTENWVFCPDNVGDGTMMTFGFEAGTSENNFDYFWVYDGTDNTAPLIEGNIDGALAGRSWTATNATGCLTVIFDADGSSACANGGVQTPIVYTVGCSSGGPEYTWEWTPAIPLNNYQLMNPAVTALNQTTTFTLTGYPVGHPACAHTDAATVSIDPLGSPGIDTYHPICPGGSPFSMLSQLDGNPVNFGVWTDAAGNILPTDLFDPSTDAPGMYTYTVSYSGCDASAILNIDFPLPVTFVMPADTALCFGSDVNLHVTSLLNGAPPLSFAWSYNGLNVSSSPSYLFTPDLTGSACLEITDQCGTVTTDCYNVTVEQPLQLSFFADTTAACWPFTFDVANLADETLYTSSTWTFGDGTTISNRDSVEISFETPGSYSVNLFVTSPIGCQYEVSQDNYLTAFAPPLADWSADPNPTNVENTEVHFTDLSQGEGLSYDWTMNVDGSQVVLNDQNPVYVFPQGIGGEYTVNLKVTDLNGCTDTWENIIVVNELFQSFIPTAFTPNYDGVNDEWRFVGTDIDETRFSLEIFDRWGGPIFKTTDPNQGWMGQKENGESYFVQDQVYPWKATVVSKSTGERKELSGTITIIR